MESVTYAARTICAVSAALCLVEELVSGTKLREHMKLILTLTGMCIVLSSAVKGAADFEFPDAVVFDPADYAQSRELYLEELKLQTQENISAVLVEELTAAGVKAYSVETEVNISDDGSISIIRVTAAADDFTKASDIIKRTAGSSTEVINGNDRKTGYEP